MAQHETGPHADRAPEAYVAKRDRAWFSGDRRWGRVVRGSNYLHRPGEVLVATRDVAALRPLLSEASARRHAESSDRLGEHGFPVERWVFSADVDVHGFVSDARRVDARGEVPAVAPNHVFSGAQHFMFGPSGPPSEAAPLRAAAAAAQRSQRIAVFDTGVDPELRTLHPALAQRVSGVPDDLDVDGDGRLDVEAGHGTFVAGVINRVAPEAMVTVDRVLDPDGLGDELALALALADCDAPVVNLSLYGYTHHDMPPLLLTSAIDKLPRSTAVVAAAGNDATDRPAWPAAHKRVISVGALDTTNGEPRRAPFSNYGWWVDCCAPGVDVWAAYVRGTYELDPARRFDGWATWSGTSFAAPQVAALILRQAASSGATARQAAYQLLGDPDRTEVDGLGVVITPPVNLCSNGAAPPLPEARRDSAPADAS